MPISGEKAIVPYGRIARAIQRLGIKRVIGSFKLCIDENGHVNTVIPLRSTGIASYDQQLMRGISAWVYSPFISGGRPQPVCTAVTFIYTQR